MFLSVKGWMRKVGEKWCNLVDMLFFLRNVFNVVVFGVGGVGKMFFVLCFVSKVFMECYNLIVEDLYEKLI